MEERDGVRFFGLRPAFLVVLCLAAAGPAVAAPRVVVTVKPLHSLISGVMAGVAEPELVIRGAGSPHTYSLKPSDARLLERGQVIFWVGEALESFFEKPLAVLGSKARIVTVAQLPGIVLLPGREGGAWEEPHEDGREAGAHAAPPHLPGATTYDGHLWLDPSNARVIARAAAQELGRIDPANRGRYAGNAERLIARLEALDAELRGRLAPWRDRPFIVFHDAYQYFEKSYALRAVGSVSVSPQRKPGARRVREIREKIRSLGAVCVFGEPQFAATIIGTLGAGTDIGTGTLDPLGADLPAGPEVYFTLMRSLGSALAGCLQRPGSPAGTGR